jgi:sulfotransferase
MDKKYFFLGGMYRSGNTVLAAILNQNPDFYVSPLSPVVEYMWRIHSCKEDFETAIANPNVNRTDNTVSKILDNYYYDVNKKYVVDRNKAWIHIPNIRMLKEYITPNPKILFTVRPLRECVASLIKVDYDKQMEDMLSSGFNYNPDISNNDNLAEFILNGNMAIAMENAFYSYTENKQKDIQIIRYHDLLANPQETMDLIYDFLEIDKYHHDFDNIVQNEKEDDEKSNRSKNLHIIRQKLESSNLVVEDYLSDKMIEKCNNMDLFVFENG